MTKQIKVDMGGVGQNDEFITVNLDAQYRNPPDIVADITTVEFPENSIDVIRCVHTLEHLFWHQVLPTLKRWYAMLKKGGIIQIVVPDNEAIMSLPIPFIVKTALLYANPANHEKNGCAEVHKWGYSFQTLSEVLISAGFSNVRKGSFYNDYWVYDYPFPSVIGSFAVPNIVMEADKV